MWVYIFWRSNPCPRYHLQIYFPIQVDPFSFCCSFLYLHRNFLLWWSPMFILSFMSLALRDRSVKILLHGLSEIFLPMLSSRIFMVLWLIFKSFIHLEFIFVYSLSWWSSFIFLHVAVQISQNQLLRKLFLLHLMLLPPLSNINWPEMWGYFWSLYSVPLFYVSVLMPVPDCFDYCGW